MLIRECDADNELSIKEFWRHINIKRTIGTIRVAWNGFTHFMLEEESVEETLV
jgi:hypothetical protein